MKKMVLFLALLGSSLSASANSDLFMSMNKFATALPVNIASCSDLMGTDPTVKSLAAPSVKLSKPTFTWNGTGTFELQYLKIELTGPTISGVQAMIYDDFDATMGGSPILEPGQSFTAQCAIRLGALSFLSPHNDSDFTAHITAVGYTSTGLVQTSSDISVHFESVR